MQHQKPLSAKMMLLEAQRIIRTGNLFESAADDMRFKLIRGVGLSIGDVLVGRRKMQDMQGIVNRTARQRGVKGKITAFAVPGEGGAAGEAGGRKFVAVGNNNDQESAIWHEVGHHADDSVENNTSISPIDLIRREAKASKGKNTPTLRKWHAGYIKKARKELSKEGRAELRRLYKAPNSDLRIESMVTRARKLRESHGDWKKHKYIRKEGKKYIYPDSTLSANIHDFPNKTNILFVTGRSGGGKSTMAKDIAAELTADGYKVKLFELDNYWTKPGTELPEGYPQASGPYAAVKKIKEEAAKNPSIKYVIEGVQVAYQPTMVGDSPLAIKNTGLARSLYRAFIKRGDLQNYFIPNFGVWGGLKRMPQEWRMKKKWSDMVDRLTKKVVEQNKHAKVMMLVNDFKRYDKDGVIRKTFLTGNCYDFAHILWRNVPGSEIVFLKNKKHYAVKSNGRFYDITGEINVSKNDVVEPDDVGVSKMQESAREVVATGNLYGI